MAVTKNNIFTVEFSSPPLQIAKIERAAINNKYYDDDDNYNNNDN